MLLLIIKSLGRKISLLLCYFSLLILPVKYYRLGGLNTEIYFLRVLEARSLRSVPSEDHEGSVPGFFPWLVQ
jgi:hypothetical protein